MTALQDKIDVPHTTRKHKHIQIQTHTHTHTHTRKHTHTYMHAGLPELTMMQIKAKEDNSQVNTKTGHGADGVEGFWLYKLESYYLSKLVSWYTTICKYTQYTYICVYAEYCMLMYIHIYI